MSTSEELPTGLDAIVAIMQDRLALLDDEAVRIRRAIVELTGASPADVERGRVELPPFLRPQPPAHPLSALQATAASGALSRREEILAEVEAYPNSTKDDIAKRLDTTAEAVYKHLKRLTNDGAIRRTGGVGRHPATYMAVAGATKLPAAKKPAAKRKAAARKPLTIAPGSRIDRILTDVRAHPNSTVPEIAERSKVDRTSTTKLVGELRKAGFVETTKGAGRNDFSRHRAAGDATPAAAIPPAPNTTAAKPRPSSRPYNPANQHTSPGPSRADRLLADVTAHPETTAKAASERLGIADTEAYNVARKLVEEGKLIRQEHPGRAPSTFIARPSTPDPLNGLPALADALETPQTS